LSGLFIPHLHLSADGTLRVEHLQPLERPPARHEHHWPLSRRLQGERQRLCPPDTCCGKGRERLTMAAAANLNRED